jgi:GNAT superfamily N-acetyltransferase
MNTSNLDFIKPTAGPLAPVHTVVGKETDAQGNELTIWFCDIIAQTPALAPFLRNYAELIDNKHATAYVAWGEVNKLHVVYAIDNDNRFVGGIAFEYRHVSKEGWLTLSFTEKEFRGRRVNQVLHQYFEEIVRKRGGNRIASFVHKDNVSRLKSAQRVDFEPQYYRMTKVL